MRQDFAVYYAVLSNILSYFNIVSVSIHSQLKQLYMI